MDYINDHAVIEPIKNFWHWFAINTSGIALWRRGWDSNPR